MVQLAHVPTLEGAHKKVMEKITGTEHFIRRRMVDECLRPAPRVGASELRRTMAYRMFVLKTLWHAEPKFKNLGEWIAIVKDEVQTKLKALEPLNRTGTRRTQGRHDPGTQNTIDPTGDSLALRPADHLSRHMTLDE
jgi:hypothetical protein